MPPEPGEGKGQAPSEARRPFTPTSRSRHPRSAHAYATGCAATAAIPTAFASA